MAEEAGEEETWTEEIIEEDEAIFAEMQAKLKDKDGNIVEAYQRRKDRPADFQFYEEEARDVGYAANAPFSGAIQTPTSNPEFNPAPPDFNLTLEYVYGYRCFDTR
jgi:WD40 repeat protein